MLNENIWNLFKMLFSFLYVIMMFPKRTNCDQDVLKTNQCDQNVPTNHMVKTFSECHWGNFKCCINVPIGSRSNTWSGNIWNIPNLLSAGKWWVPSTRAYNVLKMFLLVSRPPCPQWVVNVHFKMSKTFLTLLTQSTLAISLGRHSPLSTPVNFQTSTHHHGWQKNIVFGSGTPARSFMLSLQIRTSMARLIIVHIKFSLMESGSTQTSCLVTGPGDKP